MSKRGKYTLYFVIGVAALYLLTMYIDTHIP